MVCNGCIFLPLGLFLGLSISAEGAGLTFLCLFLSWGWVILMENVLLMCQTEVVGSSRGQLLGRKRSFWAFAGKDWAQPQALRQDSSVTAEQPCDAETASSSLPAEPCTTCNCHGTALPASPVPAATSSARSMLQRIRE